MVSMAPDVEAIAEQVFVARYRVQSVPMQLAQQFLAALARDWDSRLQALADHLDRFAPESTTERKGARGRHG